MTYATLPVLGGVTLPRPNGISEAGERVGTSVELANGSLRGYLKGTRRTYELTWTHATETTVLLLRQILGSAAFVAYTHADGSSTVVETAAPDVVAIAGTDPPRFTVSISLRDQVAK